MDKFIYLIIAIVAIETALLIYLAVTSYNNTKKYLNLIKILYRKTDDLTEERCLRCMYSEADETGIWCNKYQVVGTKIEKCRPLLGHKD